MKVRLLLLAILLIPCWVISYRFNVDLRVLHTVAQWIQVDWSRIYGDTGAAGRFFYGPVTLLFLYPLKVLSYEKSFWFYGSVQTLCYIIIWWALCRFSPRLWKEKGTFLAWTFLFIFSINPIHNNFQSGNVQLMIIAILLLAEMAEPFAAGCLVAIPVLVKVYPALLVPYYLMTRKKPFFYGLVAGTIVLHLAVMGMTGGETLVSLYRDFLANLSTYGQENSLTRIPDLLSLPSLLARWGLESVTPIASGLLYAAGLGMLFRHRGKIDPHLGFSLILAIVAVINPSTRVHYFIFYVPLFSYLCNYASQSKRSIVWAEVIGVLLLLAFTVEGTVGKHLNDTLEFWSVPTFGVLLLIAIGFYRFRKLYVQPS